jgi:hypothetical protein
MGAWSSLVKELLDYLRSTDLTPARVVFDPRLNELLAPLRGLGALPFKCGRRRCRETIVYWALASSEARVLFGPGRRSRRGSVAGPAEVASHRSGQMADRTTTLGSEYDLVYPAEAENGRFAAYIHWAMDPDSPVSLASNPEVGSGYPLRFTFDCPRCGSRYTYTNTRMLEMFAQALARGQRHIVAR